MAAEKNWRAGFIGPDLEIPGALTALLNEDLGVSLQEIDAQPLPLFGGWDARISDRRLFIGHDPFCEACNQPLHYCDCFGGSDIDDIEITDEELTGQTGPEAREEIKSAIKGF